MNPARIALIGHSGAGKSSCLFQCGFDPHAADMDAALGVECSLPLEQALAWMTEGAEGQAVVVVSNHEVMLMAMHQARRAGRPAESFARIRLVYIRKPKDQLARRLGKPTAAGDVRPAARRGYNTLDSYERFDKIFLERADHVIDWTSKSIEAVAAAVNALIMSSRRQGLAVLSRGRSNPRGWTCPDRLGRRGRICGLISTSQNPTALGPTGTLG